MNWQPIETAPTNERVLIFVPKACHFDTGIYCAIKLDRGADPRWELTSLYGRIDIDPFYAPTHWMPLPASPKDGGK